jgi:glycosyltransferase involved in cell wall biosynthesis
MRVLFVNENIGGHATVHHHLRRCLADRSDVEATFLDVPPPGLLRRIVGASLPGLGRLDLDLQPLRAQLALSWWVRSRVRSLAPEFDLIHVYTQNAGLLSVAELRSKPTVVTLDTTNARNAYRLPHRSPTRFTRLTVGASRPFEQRVFGAADRVVANSEWAACSLRQEYGLAESKLETIPFGIVGPATRLQRSGGQAGLPRIVFVGRQFRAKGGGELLEAFDCHLRGLAELVLVTHESVPDLPGVEVIDDLRQGDGRLWTILADADVFAFPSPIDQAPNAVLEAMAAGLPVVAARTAAVPEMVIEGATGHLVEPGDAEGLGVALASLVLDEPRRRRMGDAGRARFEDRYDAARATERLLSVFEDVLGAKAVAT